MNSRTKWSYCVGATGRDAAYALVSMFLMLYVQYTMKLTTAQYATISACMVVCMVWDAVNDLLMGIIIENTHMKLGKFRPWILIGCLLNAVVIICLFTVRPSGWGFVVFFVISYLLWGMTYTMNDIAYWGMLPALTSDAKGRNTLASLMSVFVCIGQFSVAGIVPTIVAGNAVNSYRIVALVVALGFVAFQMLTFFGVTEAPRKDNGEKLSLKDIAKIFARNDQLVHAGIACLLFNVGNNILIVFGVNFFYVEFGYSDSGSLVFLFTVMYGIGNLISQSMFALINRKFTRRQILRFIIIVIVTGYCLLFGFGYIIPKNVVLLNAIGFLIFFCQGLFNMTVVIMVNNTIEYDEYRFNERHDSVISAVRSFSVKLAGGINQGILTLTLIISGIYSVSQGISSLENEVAVNAITSEEALEGANALLSGVTAGQAMALRVGMFGVPIVAMLSAFLILRFRYKIDEVEYNRLVEELAKRNAE